MAGEGLITRERMFEPLLAADPSLEPVLTAFVAEWREEREPPLYLALADVARHLVRQLQSGDTGRFDAVFEVIEQWHLHGDSYVREAASVGLLEDLQNLNLHDGTRAADFEPWLRPESRSWWGKVERFWSRGEILKDPE